MHPWHAAMHCVLISTLCVDTMQCVRPMIQPVDGHITTPLHMQPPTVFSIFRMVATRYMSPDTDASMAVSTSAWWQHACGQDGAVCK